MAKTLYRSKKNRIIGGVCGGMGEYFDQDPIWFRLIAVILVLGWGTGIILYLIAWLIIPEAPSSAKSAEKSAKKKSTKKKVAKKK
jgi:phage shock protein PspC (stress-responsive transcriptional regulator)